MNDEKYTFIQDIRDKKSIARNARNKRNHCGKRGAVKLPQDYMTKKELNAMNGEIATYRMNDPLTWKEFRAMPDDLCVLYIKSLRERYNVANTQIAEMMGVHKVTFANEIARLGIKNGSHKGKADTKGFLAWLHGNPDTTCSAEVVEESTIKDAEKGFASLEVICDPVPEIKTLPVRKATAVPCSGSMTFDGSVDSVIDTLRLILGGASARITVTWDAETAVRDGG